MAASAYRSAAVALRVVSQEKRGDAKAPVSTAGGARTQRRQALSFAASIVLAASGQQQSRASAATCAEIGSAEWWAVPCFPPPPEGEPRYSMPGIQYDPAREATERYKAKIAAKAEKKASKSAAAEVFTPSE